MKRCYSDPYLKRFKARVKRVLGDEIEIEPNYFFPASGGQGSDRGNVRCKRGICDVVDVSEHKGGLFLRVKPDGMIEEGEEVECEIDWKRRYKLMKAHTAEHMLFQALSRIIEDVKPEKVSLDEGLSLFLKCASIDWSDIAKAERMVNAVIREGRKVKESIVPKERVPEDVRIKMDRIEEGWVRIIEVEDFDKVACSGLHVRNTSEIEAFCVNRMTKHSAGIWKVDFLIGDEALEFLIEGKNIAMDVAKTLKTSLDKVRKTTENMKRENELREEALRETCNKIMDSVKPIKGVGFNFYILDFRRMERKNLLEMASKISRNPDVVGLFMERGEGSFVLFKGKGVSVSLERLMNIIKGMGGKGGGGERIKNGMMEPSRMDEVKGMIMKELGVG